MFKTIKTDEQLAQENSQQQSYARIVELKRLLAKTDYIALTDYDKEKPDVIAQRQSWREEIRLLEAL
jgi:hypothetical protein